jgi:hypothetical protein
VGISGTFTPGGASYVTTGNTIEYNANGAQNIAAFSYNNLTLSTGGTKTFASDTTKIAGTLSLSGATANATTNSSIIEYNGSGPQTVTPMTYYKLNFTNGGTKSIFNTVVVNSDVLVDTGAILVIDAAGTFNTHGFIDNNGTLNINGILTDAP